MATECIKPIRGKVMRVTKLDACGAYTAGAKSVVVSDGFVSVEMRPNRRDPDEIEVPNANGDLCISERSQAKLKWYDLTINFCAVDLDLYNLTTGAPQVLDDAGTPNVIGFREREGVSAEFALEVWTDLAGQTCTVTGDKKYGYFLIPWVTEAVVGDRTIENSNTTFTLTARSRNNAQWGTGPYNISRNAADSADVKLATAIAALDHVHFQVVTSPPPTASCGATTLTPVA